MSRDIRFRGRIQKLNRLMELLDSSDHLLVRMIGALILWKPQILFALERWRRESGPLLRRWLAAAGEFEALSALANYAFRTSGRPVPRILGRQSALRRAKAWPIRSCPRRARFATI